MGRPSVPRYRIAPVSPRRLALAGADQVAPVTWRQGTRATKGNPDAAMSSHFLAIRVRPAGRGIPRGPDGSLPECWPSGPRTPRSPPATGRPDLPPDTPIPELARLARIRWRAGHGYRELKHGLGLDHLEGRSYLGWHRHGTLTARAQAFRTMLRTDPKAPAPG